MAIITSFTPELQPELPDPSEPQDPTMKWCPRCELYVPRTSFRTNRAASDGLYSYCAPCVSDQEQSDEMRQSRRASHFKRSYGLTIEQHTAMRKAQQGRCAICEQKFKTSQDINVDHDHKTGNVRALLCTRCNSRLAVMEDPAWITQASNYLIEHGTYKLPKVLRITTPEGEILAQSWEVGK